LKTSRHKKVLGLALGEKSLLAAEVAGGDRPQVKRLAELIYPSGVTLQQPKELGVALAAFLKENDLGAKVAVIGIPAKWLVVKQKEVPLVDQKTLINLLRLQAESEFSTELKDLVYEFADGKTAEGEGSRPVRNVLLLGTQQKYIDLAKELGEEAGLKIDSVVCSALALGRTTGLAMANQRHTAAQDVLVLSTGTGGSELTAQSGSAASAVKYMRPLEPRAPFVSELRRAVSTMPAVSSREIVVWDGTGLDITVLEEQVGMPVRSADLKQLGVDAAGFNGDGRRFATAVAIALAGLDEEGPRTDFLHSRLAPPAAQKIPRWAIGTGLAVVAMIALIVWALQFQGQLQDDLLTAQNNLAAKKTDIAAATDYVKTHADAINWRTGKPQFLACLRDVTAAIPEDNVTYATTLSIKEAPKPILSSAAAKAAAAAAGTQTRKLAGKLEAKTSMQQPDAPYQIANRMKQNPAFGGDARVTSTVNIPRQQQVQFTIEFTYDPTKAQ